MLVRNDRFRQRPGSVLAASDTVHALSLSLRNANVCNMGNPRESTSSHVVDGRGREIG